MKRIKLFLENFIVYGLGGAINKIVPLIMLPIITRLMSTGDFGLYNLSTIVVQFGSAIAVMGLYDAMFRLFFDKDDIEYKKEICSSALFFTLVFSIVLAIIMMLFRYPLSSLFFGSEEYVNLLGLSVMSVVIGSTNSIVALPTRMNNERVKYLVANTISPIIAYALAIPLLLKGWYILALPIANLISVFVIELYYWKLNHSWFSVKRVRSSHLKSLLKIGAPLMPNILMYWVFNSFNTIMITHIISKDAAGVFGAGAKIGQISQLIYTAFAGGWQYFAFSTMKDDDQVQLTSNIFECLGIVSFMAGVMMTACNNTIFKILFTQEYAGASVVAPYLFIAPLLLMLFQTAVNQFLIIKKTWPNSLILLFGATINVAISYVLLPRIGILGAALGTLAGYGFSVIVVALVLQKMKLLKISWNFIVCVLATVLYYLGWQFIFQESTVISVLLALLTIVFFGMAYNKIVKKGCVYIKQNVLRKKKEV